MVFIQNFIFLFVAILTIFCDLLVITDPLTSKLNPFPNKPLFFTCLQSKSFENTVGKGEIASPFPTLFSIFLENFLPFSSNSKLSPANSFSLKESIQMLLKWCFLSFSAFPTIFSKGFYPKVVKSQDCVVKS